MRPRHAEAALDVRAHLGAETEDQTPSGQRLDVVGDIGDCHRSACQGDGDRGEQLDPLTVLGRQCEWDEGVVAGLHRDSAIVAEALEIADAGRDLTQRCDEVAVDLHGRSPLTIHAAKNCDPPP